MSLVFKNRVAKIALLASAISLSACTTVGPGHIGILWTSMNGTQNHTYGEGAYDVLPWNTMYVYNLRTQNHDEVLDVIASNGLNIKLDASIRYHVNPKEIVALQRDIGPDYYDVVIAPILRSEARRVIGQYTPEEIYSTKRDVIEREIREGLKTKMAGKHIVLEAVLIRNVELPDAIRSAIDQKLEAQQDVLRMKYILQVAQSQADQKRIEAQGVADYNHKIASSLSPAILEFERIQQLSQLATSPNAKTVVMGSGTNPRVLLSAGGRK